MLAFPQGKRGTTESDVMHMPPKLRGLLSIFGLQIMLAPSDDTGQGAILETPPTAIAGDDLKQQKKTLTTASGGDTVFKRDTGHQRMHELASADGTKARGAPVDGLDDPQPTG